MPLYIPTFNDATPATNLAGVLRTIAVGGAPRDDRLRHAAIRDDVSDAVAGLANTALRVLRDHGSAGLADWLVMHISNEPDDLFASMAQRRFVEALLDEGLLTTAEMMDTDNLWTDTGLNAPAAPVSAPRGAPWTPRTSSEGDRHFTPRVNLPLEP
jgi:hypothetical protein